VSLGSSSKNRKFTANISFEERAEFALYTSPSDDNNKRDPTCPSRGTEAGERKAEGGGREAPSEVASSSGDEKN